MALLLLTPRSCAGFLGDCFPVGFLTFRFGSSLLVSPPVEFPFRVSSACSYSGPRSGFSLHSSVFPSFVTRSNLSSFATGSSLRAESRLSGFSCILSPGFASCPLLLVSFLVCSDFSPYFPRCVGYYLLRRVFLAVSILLLVAGWLSCLRLVCFYSSF